MNKHSYLAGTAHMRSTHPAVEEADSPLKETERHHHPEHSLRNASTGPLLRRRSYDFLMMHGHSCLRTLAHAMLASAWNTSSDIRRAHSQTFCRSLLSVPSAVQPALTTLTHTQTFPSPSSCLIFLHRTHDSVPYCLPSSRQRAPGEGALKKYPSNE